MSSLLEQASLVVTPNGTKASKLYSVKPTDGSGDMTVVRSTTATRVNSSGLIESSAINVPRLDYTGSTCPSILVEPQRTNIALWSDMFENSTWSKASGVIVTANVEISPDGTLTADYIQFGASNSFVNQTTTLNIGVVATGSFYIKGTNGETIQMSVGGVDVLFTLNGNWQRIEATRTSISNNFNINTFGSSTARNIYLWGAQLEVGANATSYIPTVASTVTRNADVISKTGISDLIGQTEGTIFAEVNFTASNLSDRTIVNLSDNTTANWIFIRTSATVPNGIRFRIANGGALQFDYNSSAISTGVHKLCLSYKLNNISAYIDGVKVSSSTTATIPATSKINIGCMHDNLLQFNDRIKSALLFKTQLTDQECINLTTI